MKSNIREDIHHGEERVSDTVHDLRDRAESLQRDRFGGFNFGAAFFGWLVAVSVSVLLTALLSAAGSAIALTTINSTQQAAASADTVGLFGAISLLVVLGVAYYAGGYVAGRMSRFDGGRQGFGAWLIGIAAAILLALAGIAFGSQFNVLQSLHLPAIPVDGSAFTLGGVVTLLAALIVTALTAIAGGKVGERYHHKVDAAGRTEHEEQSHGIFGGRLAHHH